ncbi:MAG: T9SS type A sorting domain-containing protein, partial [Bacteroidales bacterium]|nr:T9SS type A sorting domain-containing protein [Bacteroidales bacterium]
YENQNVSVFVSQNVITDKFEFTTNPNPFSDEMTITYNLPETAYTKIDIYNSAGEKIKELFSKFLTEGKHVYNWKTSVLLPGIYFIRLQVYPPNSKGRWVGNEIITKKIIKL